MSVPEPQLDIAAQSTARDVSLCAVESRPDNDDPSPLSAWLDLLCRMVPGVETAYAGIDPRGDAEFRLSAAWPHGTACDPSTRDAIRYASLRETGIVIEPVGETDELIARRITVAPAREGVVAIRVPRMQDPARETLLRLLEWGEAWLGLVMRIPAVGPRSSRDTALDVMSSGLCETTLRASATAMAASIAAASKAERVSVGLFDGDRVELIALSHTASFDPRTQISKDITAAMEEAIDEGQTIVCPLVDDARPCATRAHERLCTDETTVGACTIILRAGEALVGTLTLEYRSGDVFDAARHAELEDLGAGVARILLVKQAVERPLRARFMQSVNDLAGKLYGPGRFLTKALALAAFIGVGVLFFADGALHVSAPATLEGRVHRTLTAPIEGYVAEAPARAGDAVKTGDVLAVIDTRGLEFERRRWANERSEFEKAHRKAVAQLDRAEATIMKARLGKATSQLALIEDQLSRATVTAPFDGIVVSGDLSRSMGAPVSRGDVLFELAPLDDYRVELEVDERDIADVVPGQGGHIALTALPGERLPFVVDKVTGVAEAGNGRNIFKVEGRLEAGAPLLRPGMHGVGKITAGEAALYRVWTHHLVDRVHLWLWSRAP